MSYVFALITGTEEPAKPPAPYPKKADVEDERKEREAKKESESDEKDESGDKQENGSAKELNEEEKQRLKEENWEHRKGSGLGSLMNFLRGDGKLVYDSTTVPSA